MKIKKLLAAMLAATMLTTAACGLVGCDKDTGELGRIPSGVVDGDEQGTEYTVTFNANGGTTTAASMTTTNGKLSGTMPTASKGDDYDFLGWATSSSATTPDITASNFTTYTFTGTTKTVTLYAVYKAKDVGLVESGHDLYVNDTLVANLLPGTADADADIENLVWGWYATDIMFYVGDKVTFTANGEEENIVAMEAKEGAAIVGVGEIIEGTTVEVSKDGLYTVEFTQWQDQVADKRCSVYIGSAFGEVFSDDYYIVGGEGFGDWADCLAKYHFNSETVEITVELPADAEVKIAKANESGGINWDSALGIDNVTVGKGYVKASEDGMGNIVFVYGGTYTIKIVDGAIQITSDDVEEPELDWIIGDYYVVGESAEFGAWGSCLKDNHIGTTSGEIEITVAAGVAIKLAKANSSGGIDWSNNPLGAGAVTVGRGYISADGDGNIVFNEAGTYTIKLVNGKIEIYSDIEEPEIELPETKLTLTFNDATIIIALELPNWDPATSDPSIYITDMSGGVIGASKPGAAMNGSEVSVNANLADCKVTFFFKQGNDTKESYAVDATTFKDGATYIISVGGFSDSGNGIWLFTAEILEV